MIRFQSWASSHPGAVRAHNEDSFVDRSDIGLWAVADGAGGHDAGELASGMLKDELEAIPPDLTASELLAQVRLRVEDVHQTLREKAAERGPHSVIASTLVVLLARDGHFACLWAGDARVYLLRDGLITQVTRDHSLVQELVDAGAITAEEAEGHPRANVITRAIGAADSLELDKVSGRLVVGDRFLLCSDGLNKTLSDNELAGLLTEPGPADRLISEALARRASDNVTVVAIEAF